jgi:methyl-accepting chemotaxis protein
MNGFRNLKVQSKFLIIGAFILLFMLGLGGVGVWGVDGVNRILQEAQSDQIPSIYQIGQTIDKTETVRVNYRQVLIETEPDKVQKAVTATKDSLVLARASWESYTKLPYSVEEKVLWPQFETVWKAWNVEIDEVLRLAVLNTPDAHQKALTILASGQGDKVTELLGQLSDISYNGTIVLAKTARDSFNLVMTLILVTIVVVMALTVATGLTLSRSLTNPLGKLQSATQAVTAGDLTQRADVATRDEIGQLAKAFNLMIGNLEQQSREIEQRNRDLDQQNREIEQRNRDLDQQNREIEKLNQEIGVASQELNGSAAELMALVNQQTAGTSEQSAAIHQTTSTVNEVRATTEQTSLRAKAMSDSALRSADVAEQGQQVVSETIIGMNVIKEQVEGIAENILALSEQTQQIGEIISTVNDIAEQSNLLALNAAVEAARAGEHGRGFAVVANEVRSLAERSKQATTQVRTILSDIQKATNVVVMVTEEGTKGVDHGVKLVDQAGRTIRQLSEVIRENLDSTQQIIAVVQQQNVGVEQVAQSMGNINEVTNQNVAANRQLQQSVEAMNRLADRLDKLTSNYKSANSPNVTTHKAKVGSWAAAN